MLQGIRVLDFTQNLPGPFAGMRLAERGADVVKVEPPSGDPARYAGEKKGENGLVFLANNRGKKSVCLDLKNMAGRQVAQRLAQQADVILESFRPGVMDRLGLGYESIIARNPTVIYASLTGYDPEGEVGHLGSHDLNYMALSGMLAQFKEQGKPIHPTILLADLVGGVTATESILAALYQRRAHGRGAHLHLSLTHAMLGLMGTHDMIWRETGQQNGVALLGGSLLSYGLYQTKDDKWIAIAALEPKFWRNFCEGLDQPHWIDAQYTSPHEENEIYREVCRTFASRTRKEWTQFGLLTDCCLTPVLEVGERQEHPGIPSFSEGIDAPTVLGQDTEGVLTEWLNTSDSQMQEWQKGGAFR
ncbi:Crotonobetainyl-CoA:carnitine CoA-transferase CaiB [Marininema mesophilum]|uniref:Crotonobetainyl-CoA:carnitine CoA-transferase CaiB n=1 Tax=Marininema mesophilum TaxID=1048340 RepID=A0A1H2U538_9BACL|nr:CaiB/BaiF CoA-transferase family protein [Marininema mesophilum]SDW51333.1 Crotonobetainyl-CoA:carnitine CoA-transferase CaiB [Marininema mesophilum]